MITSEIWLKIISYVLMFAFIIIIIPLHLFSGFISGFLAHEIIVSLTPLFERFVGSDRARWVVVTFIAIFVVIIMTIIIISLMGFLTKDIQQDINIITEINHIFSNVKNHLPNFPLYFLPENTEELKNQIINFTESNLTIIHNVGKNFLHGLITLFIGLIIGAIISLNKPSNHKTYFTYQLLKRVYYLSQAFRNIVFAQVKVSLINTVLTAIMILIILPLFNIYLPLSKTLIILTFIFGLLPIIGNLFSNAIVIISALSISITVGGIMLIYLIMIHKIEYFLNAEIIGNRIKAKSWELLLAMLLLEAAFGIEGLIAAPIYYAYLKTELRVKCLI